uniref:Uncharacterized protein n=1 Tax=Oreochromis niloticus TaxID=8128 RepID=A0A669EDJ1_ORENI
MKVSIPASGPSGVTVLPKTKGWSMVSSRTVKSRPSGYYFHSVWRALRGPSVPHFNTSSAITQCLKGRWFIYTETPPSGSGLNTLTQHYQVAAPQTSLATI